MKINRMAEENKAPSWAFESQESQSQMDSKILLSKDVERLISLPVKGDLSEDQLVEERDVIEKCASSNKKYFYNVGWGDNIVNALKEYASVCGIDLKSLQPLSFDYISNIKRLSSNDSIIKTASSEKSNLTVDAFKIDEKINALDKEESNWQEVRPSIKLNNKPSLISNTVRSLRGGEDYLANSIPQTARGQNSILDPNAIDNYVKDSKEDVGDKIIRENKQKMDQYKNRKAEWEKEIIEGNNSIVDMGSRGKVFVTESMNVQSGIKGDVFNYDVMPEKTVGETIKDINEERQKNKKHTFETKGQSSASISDDFTESLKKYLKQ